MMMNNTENSDFFLSSIGTEPIENPDIPADINDGDDIAKLDFGSEYVDPEGLGTRTLDGTDGADTFRAEALLNATPEIVAKYTNSDGTINWQGVAGENDNYHDHWVEGPGDIVINNFGEGDKFILRGHTAEAILIEESDNQAVIGLVSDQGRDGSRGNGAHDLDILGKATINHDGSFNFAQDVKDITNNVFDGVASTLEEFEAMGEDAPSDMGGDAPGNMGEDAGDQDFLLRSIGTEPIENPDIPADINDGDDIAKLDFGSEYVDPEGLGTRTLDGTDGADTFRAEALLNATPEIVAKYTNSDGTINWQGVAGENDNYHDHWVEGPGDIVINNFGEGDKFILRGHTAEAILIEESDNQAVIGLISDQGRDGSRGTGAHDLDILGKATINHDGSFNFAQDVSDITNNVFDGVI